MENNFIDEYCEYVQNICPDLDIDSWFSFAEQIDLSNLNEPKTSIELNNFAVMALIEAENTTDLARRNELVNQALEALYQGAQFNDHPLCLAHFALGLGMLGNIQKSLDTAFSAFLTIIQYIYFPPQEMPLALVYLPAKNNNLVFGRSEQLENMLVATNGYSQALLLLTAVFNYYNFIFYSEAGKSFLQLSNKIIENSSGLNCQLGICLMFNQNYEGLFYLQKARELNPDHAPIVQAIHLAYRDLNSKELSGFWQDLGQEYHQQQPDSLDWKWTTLPTDSPFTYIAFDDYLLTVEPTLKSVVTAVLLAQGDWFEKEMEYWRYELQPGMTVIDVGANLGVYTFSAARCVGPTGKVIAVEPFSACVQCLTETCRVNQLPWVKVYEAAASDRQGQVFLATDKASVFNQVVSADDPTFNSDQVQQVNCITLDSLIESENLTQVDWLKIDAEGHEMQVLQGCDRLIREFSPKIIYENLVGEQANNAEVREFLISKGYRLFTYRPYVRQLFSVDSPEQLESVLNVIAIPTKLT